MRACALASIALMLVCSGCTGTDPGGLARLPYSIGCHLAPEDFVRHQNGEGKISPIVSLQDSLDAQFFVKAGLADGSCISFEAALFPHEYLRHSNWKIYLHENDQSDVFREDATFCMVGGLANPNPGWLSLKPFNYVTTHYLRYRGDGFLYIDPEEPGEAFRNSATFQLVRTGKIQSYNYPNKFFRHANSVGMIHEVQTELEHLDTQFRIGAGLSDPDNPNALSFEAINYPGRYLRYVGLQVRLEAFDGSELFKTSATFYRQPGLADQEWASFVATTDPPMYVRHQNSFLVLSEYDGTTLFREDATFRFTDYYFNPLP